MSVFSSVAADADVVADAEPGWDECGEAEPTISVDRAADADRGMLKSVFMMTTRDDPPKWVGSFLARPVRLRQSLKSLPPGTFVDGELPPTGARRNGPLSGVVS